MKTKNLTPFLFGSKVTSLRPAQMQMTMIVKGTFELRPGEPLRPIEALVEQGPMRADVFLEADEDRAGECLYASDFADFKLHADVLLSGACHTPGGRPLPECPVRFTVGAWSKSLMVTGRRVWTEKMIGASVSDPHPFASMPLTYANAFGGPSNPKNPAGKGQETPELPNVEPPGTRVRGKGDRPEPAGFGPLSPAWPQRAGKVGKQYGAKWKKERAPFYAEDFDWTYFNAAPPDQQLQGYLRGDEEIGFVNLHPAAPSFSARLPGLRVRAFAKDVKGVVREAPMKLDTLLADLDKETLVLTWRGLVPVEQDDLADVKTVLIASEKLDDPLLPEAHYLEILEAFEADPLEMDRHVPGARKAMAALTKAAEDDAAHPERTPAERAQAFLESAAALVDLMPEDQRPEMQRALAQTAEKLAAEAANPPPPAAPAHPSEAIGALLAKAGDAVKQLRAIGAVSGQPVEDVDEIERMLDDPAIKKALAAFAPPRPDEIGPGKDLSGRNLSRMDLSGVDLSGANLEEANLMEARLVGTRLTGANLRQAILMGANLEGADLSGADLSRAMLTSARAPGASFHRAKLDQALFQKVDLRGATFTQATCNIMILSGSDLTESNLRGCDFFKVFADSAILERADLTEARLVQCSFLRAKAERVTLARALLTSSSFADSDLRRANLTEARGEGTNWSRAILEEADFRFAALPAAHFMEAKATGARFFGADLRRSEFYRACLDRADFEKANLFGVNLNKSTLNGTRFVNANLYDARFLGASGKGCDLNGANLERAMLPS